MKWFTSDKKPSKPSNILVIINKRIFLGRSYIVGKEIYYRDEKFMFFEMDNISDEDFVLPGKGWIIPQYFRKVDFWCYINDPEKVNETH